MDGNERSRFRRVCGIAAALIITVALVGFAAYALHFMLTEIGPAAEAAAKMLIPAPDGADGAAEPTPAEEEASGSAKIIREFSAAAPDEVTAAAANVVAVAVVFQGGELAVGTGFILRDGVIITSAHLVESREPDEPVLAVKVLCDDRIKDGYLEHYDVTRDAAVVAANCPGRMLFLDERPAKNGEKLFASGLTFDPDGGPTTHFLISAPADGSKRLKDLDFSSYPKGTVEKMRRLLKKGVPEPRGIKTVFVPGNSGSMIVRGDGGVVGMLVISDDKLGMSFYVPAKNILHVLGEAGLE